MIVEKISDNCTWKITDDGTLVISPAEGELGHLNCGGRMWPWRRETFKRVRLEGHIIAGKDMSYMFWGNYALEDVSGLKDLDTTGVRYMDSMFRNCIYLRNISGLENWDVSGTLNMDLMFANCVSLKSHKTLLEKWRQKNNNSRYGGDRTVSPERLFPNINDPMTCPRTGSFTGWKKCNDAKIVELLIPADAKRSSSIGRECRCDKAVVMEIYDKNGQSVETAVSWYDDQFVYYRGKTVSVPNFDEDRFDECAPGIHFFMTRSEAESWPLR